MNISKDCSSLKRSFHKLNIFNSCFGSCREDQNTPKLLISCRQCLNRMLLTCKSPPSEIRDHKAINQCWSIALWFYGDFTVQIYHHFPVTPLYMSEPSKSGLSHTLAPDLIFSLRLSWLLVLAKLNTFIAVTSTFHHFSPTPFLSRPSLLLCSRLLTQSA